MVCTNCGFSNEEGAGFCIACKKTLIMQPDEAPQTAALQNTPPPAEDPAIIRAVWVFGAGLLFTLLASIIAFLASPVVTSIIYEMLIPVAPLVMGFGFYIIHKGETGYKMLGFAGLLLFAFLHPFAMNLILLCQWRAPAPLIYIFTHTQFLRALRPSIVCNVLVIAVAFGGGAWLRDNTKFSLRTRIASIIIFIVGFIADWGVFAMQLKYGPDPAFMAQLITGIAANAGFFMLAAMLANMMAGLKSRRIQITGGARAWCLIAVCAMALSLMFSFFFDNREAIFTSCLLLPALAGMIMLCANRRLGFTLALLGAGMSVMYALTGVFKFRMLLAPLCLGYMFGGTAVMMVTWLLISRAWRRLPEETEDGTILS